MASLEAALAADRALVVGVGGGGDVVGAYPTADLLERHGVATTLGGLAWERAPHDDRPGPRSLDEVEDCDRVADAVGLAGPSTRTADGLEFTETRVARHLDERVALLDVTRGAPALAAGLDRFCERRDVDVVVGVDAGGDAVAAGDEPGILSPLADGIAVAALDRLDRPTLLGVFGAGSDGELTRDELDDRFAAIADRGGLLGCWGLTPRVADAMEALVEAVGTTESSALPVAAARGAMGERAIRGGERTVEMTPLSTTTVFLATAAVAAGSDVVDRVREAASVGAAHDALVDAGYTTELEVETERLGGRDRGER